MCAAVDLFCCGSVAVTFDVVNSVPACVVEMSWTCQMCCCWSFLLWFCCWYFDAVNSVPVCVVGMSEHIRCVLLLIFSAVVCVAIGPAWFMLVSCFFFLFLLLFVPFLFFFFSLMCCFVLWTLTHLGECVPKISYYFIYHFSFQKKTSPALFQADSLLSHRGNPRESEKLRKLKNEFMGNWDGLLTKNTDLSLFNQNLTKR